MADVQLGNVKAKDAIEHIRKKLDVPTQRWDDMLGAAHARAFTVAGATKMDLLKDLHDAVTQAITDGQSIGEFRNNFGSIVQQHGWEYNGNESWRTRVIYDTNMRTAHMAGRWKQIQETKNSRPYLIYKTVGDSHVRPQHAAWDNTVLPVDDPWWDTHYPPNDWGCRCYVRSADEAMLADKGLSVADSAPPLDSTERINTRTGEVYGEVPKGIGVGWNYNVGKAWLGPDAAFGEKLVQLPKPLRQAALDPVNIAVYQGVIADEFAKWASSILTDKKTVGRVQTVGFMDHDVLVALEDKDMAAQTATITIDDSQLLRMKRKEKEQSPKGDITLPADMIINLPSMLNDYQAVLFDRQKKNLVYVLKNPVGNKTGRVTVEVNFPHKGDITNSIRSGSIVLTTSLHSKGNYVLLAGKL